MEREKSISELEQVAIATNDPILACFLIEEPGVDVPALQRVVIEHGTARDLLVCASHLYNTETPIPGGDLVAIENAFLQREPYSERYALDFLAAIPGADANKFGCVASERGSADHITRLLHEVKGLNAEVRALLIDARDRLVLSAQAQEFREH